MLVLGQSLPVKFSFGLVTLAMLFVSIFLTYIFLRGRNTTQNRILKEARKYVPDRTARLMVAQSAHETSVAGVPFMSSLSLLANNIFGYKYIGQSLAVGNYGAYAKYDSIENSTKEVAQWIIRKGGLLNMFPTVKSYATWLKLHNYYEDSVDNYSRGLEFWYKKLKL